MLRMQNKYEFGTITLIFTLFSGMIGCSGNAKPVQPAGGGVQAMPVKVMEAKAMPVNDASEYVATLKSRDSAVIMPQVEGQITQIFVHSGDRVAEGALSWRSIR